jgi:NAD(P)-dependent dehydrogenase (short-subunit alcohol dehydrogenase family)
MKARNYAESYRLRRGSYFIKCDVSKSADVKPWSKTIATFGDWTMLNNAGIEGDSAPTADCTEENWDKTIAINLRDLALHAT